MSFHEGAQQCGCLFEGAALSGIRSLTRLIRQAAITAIHDGTERITKATLEAIRLDHLAETHHRPHTRAQSH